MSAVHRMTVREIQERLIGHGVENVVEYLTGTRGRTAEGRMFLGDKSGAPGNSLVVTLDGKNQGRWSENIGGERGDLIDLWAYCRGVDKGTALQQIAEYLHLEREQATAPAKSKKRPPLRVVASGGGKERAKEKSTEPPTAAPDSVRAAMARLRKNPDALAWLASRGFSDWTIETFHLGLSAPYKRRDGTVSRDALMFPIRNAKGQDLGRNAYYNIPGVTQHPVEKNGWCSSQAELLYYADARTPAHTMLFLADGFKDLWRVRDLIRGSDLEGRVLIVSGSNGAATVPSEAQSFAFWNGFEQVYLGLDNDAAGEAGVYAWARYAGLKARRVKPPVDPQKDGEKPAKDWCDFLDDGGTLEQFQALLDTAEPVQTEVEANAPKNVHDYLPGQLYGYEPLDLSSAYVDGHLYYPVIVTRTGIDPHTFVQTATPVVRVVRSDGQILGFRQLPRDESDPTAVQNKAIWVLDDGTLIGDRPRVSTHATWRWGSIQAYTGGRFRPRRIENILADVERHLRGLIWLPNEADYRLCTLIAAASYLQAAFDAVPYLMVVGPKGTGKSSLGEALARISANAMIAGEVSGATFSRTVNQTAGLMILDDFEKLAEKSSIGSDMILSLIKTGYKKSTAKRVVANRYGDLETLNFFGIKVFTNTQGMEEIAATRCLFVSTQLAPPEVAFKISRLYDLDELDRLRDEFHCWAFGAVTEVVSAYETYPREERIDEITAPLRGIADQCGEMMEGYHAAIDAVVARTRAMKDDDDTPEEVARRALINAIARGYDQVAMEQVLLEMRLLVSVNWGKRYTTEIPEWSQPEWIRKHLRRLNYIDRSSETRQRPNERGKPIRYYRVTSAALSELARLQPERWAKMKGSLGPGYGFCRRYDTCETCPYSGVSCELRATKAPRTDA